MADFYQQQARVAKALTLTEHLWTRGIRAENLDTMHDALWLHHAKAAGVKDTSDDTKAMVGRMLSKRAELHEEAAKPDYDPFAGLA